VALEMHRRVASSDRTIVVPMRRGARMHVPMSSAQTWRAAFTGEYDEEEVDLLLRCFEPGSFALDIGASLGFYAIAMGMHAKRSGGVVVAVEPIAANCRVLEENIDRNELSGTVHVLPYGLGAQRADVLFHVEAGGSGNATIVSGLDPSEVAAHDRAGGTSTIASGCVLPLDSVDLPAAATGRRCSIVKIDAEGFELDIMAGGADFFRRHRPVVCGEFNQSWLATRGVPEAAVQDWAEASGYACWELLYRRTHPLGDRRSLTAHRLSRSDARTGTPLVLVPAGDEPPVPQA
jgi:FkbM family methyltransferase